MFPSSLLRPPSLVVLTLVLALAACDNKPATPPPSPPPEVKVVTMTPERVAVTTELPGRTSAFRVAEVRPQVSGIILKRLFTEGGPVKAGEALYRIDPAPYAAALQSAKAALTKATATANAAAVKAKRYRELVNRDVVSRQAFDDVMAAEAESAAQVGVAKAAVDTAKINLMYTNVLSPLDGMIGSSAFTEGALATANQTAPLATVTQLDPMYVDVTQSSAELLRLRRAIAAGTLQGADAAQAPVTLRLDDGQLYAEKGKLQFSDVTVDPTTGSVRLRAVFPNPQHDLLPGLFVRAVIEQAVQDNALTVPQTALVRQPDGSAAVWVVDPDNMVSLRSITVGATQGATWRVTNGLTAGERVVTEGLQKIRPGMKVRFAPESEQAPAIPSAPAQDAHPAT